MDSIFMVFIAFVICFSISSVLNVLLKTTKKRDWAVSALLSIALALFLGGFMGG
ncbi:hypothetical protein [Halobacillus trueperi]|uniref:hypothetical protein n=1 Tax=Halobacillus trueperi TaxID=156205 RepID=UPI003735DD92